MKTLPFDLLRIREITKRYPTPFHIYDEEAIRLNARALHAAFPWVKGLNGPYRNYFAVKALPNPHILKILAEEGLGFDCSSLAELELCRRLGIPGKDIFFTSNDTKAEEFVLARKMGVIINLDDISHIEYLARNAGFPETICFRYNPGPLREGNAIIGKPEEAKYGLTREQIFQAYETAREAGAVRFGLHTMVASNELNPEYFVETARMLFELALEIHSRSGIRVEFINMGGGIGIPYRPDQKPVDFTRISEGTRAHYNSLIAGTALDPLGITTENGRVIAGPYGYLVTQAIHEKHTYREYVGVDASMANLMRPGMYGAYHHITVLGKEGQEADKVYDVVGSLCENNDKFAINRSLPAVETGDYLVVHDTGAHGHSMGFNYNGKLRSAELLLRKDGSVKLIRRAETIEDYFSTLDFSEF